MQSQSNDKIFVSEQVLSQQIGEEIVLLDLAGECYFGLDPVGTRFWGLLNSGLGFPEIVKTMTGEFEVSQMQLEADLQELLSKLVNAGLVRYGCTESDSS